MPEQVNIRSMVGSLAPVFLLRILASGGALFLLIFSARWYGVVGRADVSMFMLWITLHGIFNEWLGGAQLVYWYQRIDTQKILKVLFLWTILTSGILSLLASLTYFAWELFFYLWLSFFVQAFNSTCMHVYNAMGKLKKAALINVLPTLLLLGMMMIREFNGTSQARDYFILYPLSFCIPLLIAFKGIRFIKHANNPPGIIAWFSRGAIFLVTGIGFILSARVSFFVVGNLSGKETLGKYSVALSLCEVLMIAPGILSTWFYSEVSKRPNALHNQMLNRLTIFSLTLVTFGAIFFYMIPESWFLFVIGESFTGLSTYFVPFFLAYVFLAGSVIRTHYFSGKGNFLRNMVASVAGLSATLLLGMVAIVSDFPELTHWMPFAGFMILFIMTWQKERQPVSSSIN